LEPATPIYSAASTQHTTTIAPQQSTLTNKQISQENLNVLKSITLTPPSTLNLNRNHHHQTTNNNNNNISNNTVNKFQQQFTPDDSFSSRLNGTIPGSGISLPPPAPSNKNGTAITNHNKTNGDHSQSNQFTPTDFVADFSKANIFDATNNITNNNNNQHNNTSINKFNNNSNGTNNERNKNTKNLANNTNNNSQQLQTNNLVNGGFNHSFMNGNTGDTTANPKGANTDNWADFEHNPVVYNSAGNNFFLESPYSCQKSNVINSPLRYVAKIDSVRLTLFNEDISRFS
jgi:hypothetical protein